ncbi:MAG: AAA family ATPase [Myxococcota bacterium]|nr:AAA family ATPase [Myxococcota bacterium]
MSSISVVPITDRELDDHLERATNEVVSFSYRAPGGAASEPEQAATLRGRRVAYRPLQRLEEPGPAAASEFSLARRIREVSPRDELYTDDEHHVLLVIRRGVQIHLHVVRDFEQASGLDRLKAANQAGSLAAGDEPELRAKVEAASAAGLFAFAAFVWAKLVDFRRDATEGLSFELEAPAELPLGRSSGALRAALYTVYRAIDAHARDDASLIAAVRDAAAELAARLQALQHSLRHLEFFTRYAYRVEPDEVRIAGFELPERGARHDIQVQRKRPDEVVGNHVAKLEAQRIAQRLVCYDLERQTNPFVDLGGFTFSFIGDGSPGTGKTTLIQMMVSLLRDYAAVAGLPLRYENFSVDEISDYQGRSGHNAKRFCQTVLDPRAVGFGSIDDVDQVCGNRGDRNASAGQLEVTGVLMQELAGANTVVRGNACFGLFSNYPEKVDGALRQRMQARFLVDGPRTREDYTDLLHILLGGSWELPLGSGYEPRATQQLQRVIEQKYGEHDAPSSPSLQPIYRRLAAAGLSSWREFGAYLHALREHDERFTGRAIKNISDAVKARRMDFDLPDAWLEKREAFFAKPYETRVAMIEELRGTITPEIVLQEIHRYVDSEARYTDSADERELEARTREIVLDARARKAAAKREI